MEAPPVQYVTTSDGYDIAYSVMGRGAPFVYVPGQFSNLQNPSEDVNDGPWSQALAARFRLVRYDGRGQGMSTRGLRDPQSIESLGRDFEAVVEHLELERFVLFARWYGCHIAIRYAAAHSHRLVALILDGCADDNARWPPSVYSTLPDENWEVFLLSQFPRGWTSGQARQRMAHINLAITPADLAVRQRAFGASTASEFLPRLSVPTLVLHPRDYLTLAASESMKVAARIPGARFAFIEGDQLPGDPVSGIRAIEEFLSEVLPGPALPEQAPGTPANGDRPKIASLSPRQRQVLQLIARGKTNREIAEELVLSERTVQRHIADLYLKIDVRNRAEAVGYARDHAMGRAV